MKKMYSEEQLAEIAGGQLDPSEIPSGEIVDDGIVGINEDDKLVKGSLFGKYVRIINASDLSSPLTAEQVEILKQGVFVNGNYAGFINPVIFPFERTYSTGFIMGRGGDGHSKISVYNITSSNVFQILVDRFISYYNYRQWLFGNQYPSLPQDQTDKTYALKLVNGTLTWVEETA